MERSEAHKGAGRTGCSPFLLSLSFPACGPALHTSLALRGSIWPPTRSSTLGGVSSFALGFHLDTLHILLWGPWSRELGCREQQEGSDFLRQSPQLVCKQLWKSAAAQGGLLHCELQEGRSWHVQTPSLRTIYASPRPPNVFTNGFLHPLGKGRQGSSC